MKGKWWGGHFTNILKGQNTTPPTPPPPPPPLQAMSRGPSLLTCFFWPILWARACACKSFWGFQSESKMTTVSAEAKLIPRPPALVESRKQKSCTQCNILLYAVAFSETVSQSNKPLYLETPAGVKKSEIWWTNFMEATRMSGTWWQSELSFD